MYVYKVLSYLIWYKQQLGPNKNKPLKRQQVFIITNDTLSYGVMSRKKQHVHVHVQIRTLYMCKYQEIYVNIFSVRAYIVSVLCNIGVL